MYTSPRTREFAFRCVACCFRSPWAVIIPVGGSMCSLCFLELLLRRHLHITTCWGKMGWKKKGNDTHFVPCMLRVFHASRVQYNTWCDYELKKSYATRGFRILWADITAGRHTSVRITHSFNISMPVSSCLLFPTQRAKFTPMLLGYGVGLHMF